MSAGIYAIQEDGQLVEMAEQSYASEDVLQTLLEKYPNLLAGDQIDSVEPRRWLLVKREMGIPGQENGNDRWSIDHLFLDQDAVPTLVEVKRSSDTRIRREVVGQMLDYAANGVVYWPAEKLRSSFEATCEDQKLDPEQVLLDFLGERTEPEKFWQLVKTNLKAGRVRLVFVADRIPTELKRIVEFLNEQMDPAEVLAIEIKQFVGQGLKTLVPTVIGKTTEAQANKAVSSRDSRQWDKTSFFTELEAKHGQAKAEMMRKILHWAEEHDLDVIWGNGVKWGSFRLILRHNNRDHRLFIAWTSASLDISFKAFYQNSPFEDPDVFSTFLNRLYSIEGVEPSREDLRDTFLSIKLEALQPGQRLDEFLAVYEWTVEEIRKVR
jgi:hypothetical protein